MLNVMRIILNRVNVILHRRCENAAGPGGRGGVEKQGLAAGCGRQTPVRRRS